MEHRNQGDALRSWMERAGFAKQVDLVDAVNTLIGERAMSQQNLSDYLRAEAPKVPSDGRVITALVRVLHLGPLEELELRRLFDRNPKNRAA